MTPSIKIALCTKVPKPPDCPTVVIDKVSTTEPDDGLFPKDLAARLRKARVVRRGSLNLRVLSQVLLSDEWNAEALLALAASLRAFSERLDEAIGHGRVADPRGAHLPAVVKVADGVYVTTGEVAAAQLEHPPAATEEQRAIARYHVERLVGRVTNLADSATRAGTLRSRINSLS